MDTSGTVGKKCAIAVDANGYPHISYRDGTVGWRLKYAQWDGSEWQIAFVGTAESVYGVTSIALDGSGNPHIAYDAGGLLHAWWDGSDWQKERVDSLIWGDVGEWNSIAFDTDGYPHIAYTYNYAGVYYLKYAYKDASGWHRSVADSLIGDEFQYVCMALDGNNNPQISYYDWKVYDLKYAYWDGAIWHIERVDTAGQVGTHSSIALDSLDYPHIAYTDGTNYGVKYARWDGSIWHIETVESDIGYGFYTSLALDANDRPHISSAEYMSDLRFAYWDGSDWQIEVVDNTVCCDWTSLSIDDSGYCHIAYYDGGDSTNLKYAKRTPLTTGVEETAPTKTSPADDIALHADASLSDNGWGGGSSKSDITDGIRTYDGEWARGLAFGYGEWHQATIDFGHQVTFDRVIQWYHGGMNNNEAAAYKLQYWNGSNWVDIFETNNSHAYLKYPDASESDWWYYWSTPYENTFAPVVSDKLRILNYPRDGSHTWLYEVEVYNTAPAAAQNLTSFPTSFILQQNYPNPFNPATTIQYVLPRNGFVRLAVYNISGQLVRTLVKGKELTGTHTVSWNGMDEQGMSVSSGIYFYCLEIGNLKSTRRMLLMK